MVAKPSFLPPLAETKTKRKPRTERHRPMRSIFLAILAALTLTVGIAKADQAKNPLTGYYLNPVCLLYGEGSQGYIKNRCIATEQDHDHDGYDSMAFGGQDCDDLDPYVHPGARDFCGNSIDEDCTNGDAECKKP